MVDEREVNASAKIFCKGRKEPLLIGSVKSHSGNTEGASGYFSLFKACIALDTGYIAPNLHFSSPNPNITPLLKNEMKVSIRNTTC